MSDLTGGATPGSESPAGAAGGPPDESDLPRFQGLDADTSDPSDPSAADLDEGTPLGGLPDSAEPREASDPMPDISGSSAERQVKGEGA